LLDILACRKDPTGVSGQLLLDGKPVPDNFKCMVGYVVQDDIVVGTLSVRENFHFSAALRLPNTVSSSQRKDRVNNVGNEFIRGVSGGERKRCNIGMELIISPPVLFLDEPTTGLDASTANTVLLFLKRLSQKGRTIIFSIHQPRYSIYSLFDHLVLLSSGYTIYDGPAPEALDFFASQGFQCEEHNNPPDFFLDVINGDVSVFSIDSMPEITVEVDVGPAVSRQDRLVEGFKQSDWHKRVLEEAEAIYTQFEAQGGEKGERHEAVQYATSFGHQVCVVANRTMKDIIRHPQASLFTIGTSLVFAGITDAIYWDLEEDPVSGFKDRGGVLFFLIIIQLFFNLTALEVFIKERKIFMHENVSGFYRVSVYFLVKVIFDILPLRTVPILLMSSTIYFAVGLNPGADHFFMFVFSLLCTTLAAAGLCFFLSATVRVFAVAQLLLATGYIFMMLFGGFLINPDSIGPWLNWVQYINLFKYSLSALYINEFKDRYFCINNGTTCKSGNTYLNEQQISHQYTWDLWCNHMALLIHAAFLMLLTYVQLRRMKKTT
ncbi:unnamed protein product, partial [Candidula unifasciata]